MDRGDRCRWQARPLKCPWLLVIFVALPRLAIAQPEAQESAQPLQELFLTETVYPQEKGEVQITLGILSDRSRAERPTLLPISIEYGLTNHWQIEGGWDGYTEVSGQPWQQLRTARASVGTKLSFMNVGGSKLHAAIGVDAEFPNADAFPADEGEDGIEIEPMVAMAFDFPLRITVFGSAAASVDAEEVNDLIQRPDDRGTLSGGALIAFRRIVGALEYTTRSDELPWRLNGGKLLTPSFTVHPGRNWELAVAVPIGINAGQRRPGLALHILKEIG